MSKNIENPAECEVWIRFVNAQNVRPIETYRTRNLKKFLKNSIKSETPVCPDVLINPVCQALSDEGRAPGSLVNVCPVLIKHSTPLSHIWLIHYTFPILCNKLTVNFNPTDILCIQKPELPLALHTRQDSRFSHSFLTTTRNRKMIESARRSLGLLLKDYWGPLTLKWCNSLTCATARCKRSLLSGQPSYNSNINTKV
jgi:hypothetical protein